MSHVEFTVKINQIDLDAWAEDFGTEKGLPALDDFVQFAERNLAAMATEQFTRMGYTIQTEARMTGWSR